MSADESAACMVARDLVELGREDEARQLLDEQAPNRLARRCPACDCSPGVPCADLDARPPLACVVRLIVPHEARLTGYIADPGPLFNVRDSDDNKET